MSKFIEQINNPIVRAIAPTYFAVKRGYYQLRYPNLSIAPDLLIKHSLKIDGSVKVSIGSGTRLGKGVRFSGSGTIAIGKNVSINGAWIGCDTAVTIGDDCLISDCFIVDTDYHNLEPHLRHEPPGPKVSAPIVLHRNVWIGARATVMKGVTVGENSVVGLGCVVRRSVAENVVVIGDPQQVVKSFDDRSVCDRVNGFDNAKTHR